jgi:hypothetical protein
MGSFFMLATGPSAHRGVHCQRGGAKSTLRLASVVLEVTELAGEVDERLTVAGDPHPPDAADDDPVVAGRMLGREVAVDGRERVA